MAIRPIFRKAVQSQIDWPLVGIAGGMAGLIVLSTTLAAWVASRSVNSVGRASGSPIGLGESSADATLRVGDVRSHAERGNEERGDAQAESQLSASYPEGDEHAVAPGATPSNGSAGASPSLSGPKGQLGNEVQKAGSCEQGANELRSQVAFAKDPAEAAVLAKQEHKLMFVLHVSGNFEESKFT